MYVKKAAFYVKIIMFCKIMVGPVTLSIKILDDHQFFINNDPSHEYTTQVILSIHNFLVLGLPYQFMFLTFLAITLGGVQLTLVLRQLVGLDLMARLKESNKDLGDKRFGSKELTQINLEDEDSIDLMDRNKARISNFVECFELLIIFGQVLHIVLAIMFSSFNLIWKIKWAAETTKYIQYISTWLLVLS